MCFVFEGIIHDLLCGLADAYFSGFLGDEGWSTGGGQDQRVNSRLVAAGVIAVTNGEQKEETFTCFHPLYDGDFCVVVLYPLLCCLDFTCTRQVVKVANSSPPTPLKVGR